MSKRKNNNQPGRGTDRPVLVKSRTYGEHYRAARGTKTPAALNEVLTAHAAKTAVINSSAKEIYAGLKPHCEGFREGQLWQALLSRMRKAKDTSFANLLQALKGLELNSRYALKRFGNLPLFTVENKKEAVHVKMQFSMPPDLHKSDDCYAYSLLVLMFNSKGVCIHYSVESTHWMRKNEKMSATEFCFEKPAGARYYLFCLQFNGGVNGVATGNLGSRGMMIVGDIVATPI